jgi:hypothetical protein
MVTYTVLPWVAEVKRVGFVVEFKVCVRIFVYVPPELSVIEL